MPRTVEIVGEGTFSFPDDATDDEIKAVLSAPPPAPAPVRQSFVPAGGASPPAGSAFPAAPPPPPAGLLPPSGPPPNPLRDSLLAQRKMEQMPLREMGPEFVQGAGMAVQPPLPQTAGPAPMIAAADAVAPQGSNLNEVISHPFDAMGEAASRGPRMLGQIIGDGVAKGLSEFAGQALSSLTAGRVSPRRAASLTEAGVRGGLQVPADLTQAVVGDPNLLALTAAGMAAPPAAAALPYVHAATGAYFGQEGAKALKETLPMLAPENWDKLSPEQKVDTMRGALGGLMMTALPAVHAAKGVRNAPGLPRLEERGTPVSPLKEGEFEPPRPPDPLDAIGADLNRQVALDEAQRATLARAKAAVESGDGDAALTALRDVLALPNETAPELGRPPAKEAPPAQKWGPDPELEAERRAKAEAILGSLEEHQQRVEQGDFYQPPAPETPIPIDRLIDEQAGRGAIDQILANTSNRDVRAERLRQFAGKAAAREGAPEGAALLDEVLQQGNPATGPGDRRVARGELLDWLDEARGRVNPERRKANPKTWSPEESRYFALTDAGTGLPNRLAYERMTAEMPDAEHLVLDVNALKAINDEYGHDAGNAYIRMVIDATKRNGIDLARYGGDEFTAVAHDANFEAKAQKALAEVKGQRIPVEGRAPEAYPVHEGFTHGTGSDFRTADLAEREAKRARRERLLAEREAERAREAGSPLVENPPLLPERGGRAGVGGEAGLPAAAEAVPERPAETPASPEPVTPAPAAKPPSPKKVRAAALEALKAGKPIDQVDAVILAGDHVISKNRATDLAVEAGLRGREARQITSGVKQTLQAGESGFWAEDVVREIQSRLVKQDPQKFSRSEGGRGLAHDVVQRVSNSWNRRMPEGLQLETVRSQAELPEHVLARVPEGQVVDGVRDPKSGKIFVVSENLKNLDHLAEILVHESVGHDGFRGVLGPEYKGFVDMVWKAHEGEIRESPWLRDYTEFNLETPEGQRAAADEWMAREASRILRDEASRSVENAAKRPAWLTRFIDHVTSFVNRVRSGVGLARAPRAEVERLIRDGRWDETGLRGMTEAAKGWKEGLEGRYSRAPHEATPGVPDGVRGSTAQYALRVLAEGRDVDVPEVRDRLLEGREIGSAGVSAWRERAAKAGVSTERIERGVRFIEDYDKTVRQGTFVLLPTAPKAEGTVVFREGVLNTPATEGIRRQRVDKVYEGVHLGSRSVETGALFEGGEERTAIPKEVRGLEPKPFLNVPITQSHLQSARPEGLDRPLVVTGNPHLMNFRRPHPSWDASVKAVRVKPVFRGNEAVADAVASAIHYANEVGARVLVTTFRAKQPWTLARVTDIVPTDPTHPDFSNYWKENPNPRPTDPRKTPDWTPFVPRNEKVSEAFRAAGYGTQKDVYGEGGTWWWPESRALDPKIASQIPKDQPLEYCDLLHKGCTACRNCQKLTYPEAAGSPIVGITDEPFCEHGCPQCFVRLGQSGVGGRKGISIGQNAKQAGFGEADLGDAFPRTIGILQQVARGADGQRTIDYVSRFLTLPQGARVEEGAGATRVFGRDGALLGEGPTRGEAITAAQSPDGKMDTAFSLYMDGAITRNQFATMQAEILDWAKGKNASAGGEDTQFSRSKREEPPLRELVSRFDEQDGSKGRPWMTTRDLLDEVERMDPAELSATVKKAADDYRAALDESNQKWGERDDVDAREGAALEEALRAPAETSQFSRRQEETPEFREWTRGAPLVRDAAVPGEAGGRETRFQTGAPVAVVAYHGTPRPGFVGFDKTLGGENTGSASARMGSFFSGSPETADVYTAGVGERRELVRGGMYRTYVRFANPLVYDFKGKPFRERPYAEIIAEAKDAGHDGVILTNTSDGGPKDNVFVTFDTKNVKSETGNTGAFGMRRPTEQEAGRAGLSQDRADARKDWDLRFSKRALTPEEKVIDKQIVWEPSEREGFLGKAGRLYQKLIRAHHSLEQFEKKIGDVSVEESAAAAYEEAAGSGGRAQLFLAEGGFVPTDEGGIEWTGHAGLKEIAADLRKSGEVPETLSRYLIARRSLELEGRDIKSGIDQGAARKVVDEAPEPVKKAAEQFTALLDDALEYWARSAGLPEGVRKAIRALNRMYVPFYRMDRKGYRLGDEATVATDQRRAALQPENVVKRIEGGNKALLDPLISGIDHINRMIRAGDLNRIGKRLVEIASSDPEAARGVVQKAESRDLAQGAASDAAQALAREIGLELSPEEAATVAALSDKDLTNTGTLRVYRDGKLETWKVDRDIADSLKALAPEDLGIVTKLLALPATGLRYGITRNPIFGLHNAYRDTLDAYLQSTNGFRPFLDTAIGLYHAVRKTDLEAEYKAASGGFSGIGGGRGLRGTAQVARHLTKSGTTVQTILRVADLPRQFLDKLSEPFEEASRLGEYRLARKAGKSAEAAGLDASRITTNFGVRGTDPSMRALTRVTAFLNPGLQGADRMVRVFKDRPAKAATYLFLRSLPIMAATAALWSVNRDDDEINELRKTKGGSVWWYVRATPKLIFRLPKPFLYGQVFGTGVETMLDKVADKDPDAAKRFGTSVAEVAAPTLMPTFLQTGLGLKYNKDPWSGAPIVPRGLEDASPRYQSTARTGEAARAIGDVLNVSPAKIEFGTRQTLGTLGAEGLKLADAGVRAAQGRGVSPPSPGTGEEPFIGRLVARTPTTGRSVERFWDDMDKIREAKRDSKAMIPNLSSERRREELLRLRPLLGAAKAYEAAADQISKLRKVQEGIRRAPDTQFPPETKRKRIDAITVQISAIAKKIVDRRLLEETPR